MPDGSENKKIAWQPLTFRGVAAFARAPLRRLLLVQFIFAALVGISVVWFLDTAWFPTIHEAIQQLPSKGEIDRGKLDWPDQPPRLLASGHFLAFSVDLKHTGKIRTPAQIQIELGRNYVRFISLFGYMDRLYPADWIISCNRTELEPWWGAWRPPILWISFGAVIAGLMVIWAIVAAIYCAPIRLVGFFANREISALESWKLAGAALMPGTLLMCFAIFLFGFGALDIVKLLAAEALHLVIGWIYAAASPFFLARLKTPDMPSKKNPFARPPESKTGENAGN